jgi:hypothetical protein
MSTRTASLFQHLADTGSPFARWRKIGKGVVMTFRARSRMTLPQLRAGIAAAMVLALGACAGGVNTRPDKPFKTANVCSGSAIPEGWIRTNDWRAKGCGADDNPAARDQRAGVQLASATAPSKAKTKTKTPVDLSRGANAVAEGGPNNWMTIAELDRIRVGRSLTVCAGAVPEGWIETARYWDKGRCGNPTKQSVKNVMLIERVR